MDQSVFLFVIYCPIVYITILPMFTLCTWSKNSFDAPLLIFSVILLRIMKMMVPGLKWFHYSHQISFVKHLSITKLFSLYFFVPSLSTGFLVTLYKRSIPSNICHSYNMVEHWNKGRERTALGSLGHFTPNWCHRAVVVCSVETHLDFSIPEGTVKVPIML